MVDASWRLQSNTGTNTATGAAPALPNPTQGGSTLLLMAAASGSGAMVPQQQSVDPPWVADVAATGVYLWRRDNQPAGETSWPLTGSASTVWAWHVQEWAGLSTVAQPDDVSRIGSSPSFVILSALQVNALSNGGSPPAPDVADFAGVAMVRAVGGTGVWPAGHSWSSPWSEVASVTVGDGTHNTDAWLLVAEAYPGVSGTLDATLTWDITGGGTYADKTVDLGAGCYQPKVPPQPADVLTS
jgi:hypothetical protein